jgi:hypothetical protein
MLSRILLAATALAASAVGAPVEARGPVGQYFTPSAIYNYDVGTGAIDCHPAGGLISKATNNGGHDITTLVTFTYPPESANKQCALSFYLDPTATLTGSSKIDVFTSLNPAPGCTTGWGPGNLRNNELGRWNAVIGGYATWDWTSSSYLTAPVPCKPVGTVEAFELVGVWDTNEVAWNPAVAGIRMALI